MTTVESQTIGESCEVGDGTHSKIPREDSGVLYLTCRNFKEGRVDYSNVYFISEENFGKYFKSGKRALICPRPGDLVFSIIGTIGEPYLVRPTDRFGISSSVAIVRPKPESIDPKFLYYWMRSPKFQGELFAIKGGVAQGYVSLEMIKSLPAPTLPTFTQRKIAGVLSAYDDLIENNLRRIKILEEMAQSLYREWFVHFRFPGHESAKFGDSLIGQIPKGWNVKKLAEIAGVNAESIRATNAPEEIQYIDIASVSTGSIDNIEAMSFESAPSRARRVVRHGDIIWSTVRPNRRSFSLIVDPTENLIASTGFAVLSARAVPWSYLYQATTTEDFTCYLVNHASGAAYPAVNSGIFENADVIVPSSELLTRFNALAEANQVLQHNLHRRNQNLRRTRDLLLPKLLSNNHP